MLPLHYGKPPPKGGPRPQCPAEGSAPLPRTLFGYRTAASPWETRGTKIPPHQLTEVHGFPRAIRSGWTGATVAQTNAVPDACSVNIHQVEGRKRKPRGLA